MKKGLIIPLLFAALLSNACKSESENESGAYEGLVSFSVKYGHLTEGIPQPENTVLTIDGIDIELTDGKFDTGILEKKDIHMVNAFNKSEGISVEDRFLTMGKEGDILPSAEWIFAYAGEKKIGRKLSVTLQQQTKQIDITVRASGGKSTQISEVSAELTEVAATRDLIDKIYKDPATTTTSLKAGARPGTFFGVARVLGFITDAANKLNLNFKYKDGTSDTVTIDLSGHADEFNEDKATINLITANLTDLGTDSQSCKVEINGNGTLDNEDNSSVALPGDKKIRISWPSYNTASELEVIADGVSYFGILGEADENGQTTENGFAELPDASKIEEVAVYLGSERISAPASYLQYDNGVITVEDCKVVYKPEQFSDDYIKNTGLYVQTADLVLPKNFSPIGASAKFTGKYDGQGFSISGMNFVSEESNRALFRSNAGIIQGIVLKNSKITGGQYNAGIVAINEGTIKDCTSYLELTVKSGGVCGGIAGQCSSGLISGCKFHGTIKVEKAGLTGGICGSVLEGAIIENCLNTGSIDATLGPCGGIAGRNRGIVRACKNTADHKLFGGTQSTGNGGVVGRNDNATGAIVACVNTGSITGNTGFGGICGVTNAAGTTITACYSTGLIIDGAGVGLAQKVVGWLLGRNNKGNVRYCYVVKEGQPTTSNGVFGNGDSALVDIKIMDGDNPAWPSADASKGWGIWTEGCTPSDGYYWKTLGSAESKIYPVLYWE